MQADEPGVPLAHYLDHPTPVRVRFHCLDCAHSHDVPILAVIDRLEERGLGNAWTGIREIARLADRPCGHCKAIRYETSPAFDLPPK